MKAKLFTTAIAAGAVFATGALAQGMQDDPGRMQDRQMQRQQMQDMQMPRGQMQDRMQRQARQITGEQLNTNQVMRIQRALGRQGFDVGPIDGQWGEATVSALESFQEYAGLQPTGDLNRQTLRELGVDIEQRPQIAADDLSSEQIEEVQVALGEAGFDVGPIDGAWGPATRTSLESFQEFQGLTVTGEVNRETLQALGVDVQAGQQRQRFAQDERRPQRSAQAERQAREQAGFAVERQSRQQQEPQRSGQQSGRPSSIFAQQDLIGQSLRTDDGQQVGEVIDLALNPRNGRIDELVVELDDGTTIAVPFDEVRHNQRNNRLVARMSAQELEDMPPFSYEQTIGMGGRDR